MSMNRKELVTAVAERSGLTGAQAQAALDAALEAIVASVAAGSKVTLPGFGTFESRERSARSGRNPQTGAAIEIPAGRVPAFKAAAPFRERVRS